MKLFNWASFAGILIAAAYLSCCTASGAGLGEVYPPPPQYVDINNSSFIPSSITVPLNTTVVWSNHDNTSETVTATDGSFDSQNISNEGYEYRYIFLTPGRYDYYSRVHPSMRGSVLVQNASGQVPPLAAPIGTNRSSNATAGGSLGGNAKANETKGAPSSMHSPANESKGPASGETGTSNSSRSSPGS